MAGRQDPLGDRSEEYSEVVSRRDFPQPYPKVFALLSPSLTHSF